MRAQKTAILLCCGGLIEVRSHSSLEAYKEPALMKTDKYQMAYKPQLKFS